MASDTKHYLPSTTKHHHHHHHHLLTHRLSRSGSASNGSKGKKGGEATGGTLLACEVCGLGISGGGRFVMLEGKRMHTSCFVCVGCSLELGGQK